jgi:hypothetical protein
VKGIPWWSDFWEKLVIEDLQGYLFNQLFYNRDELSFKEYLSDFLVRGGLNRYFNQHQEEVSLLIKKTPWQELRIWSLLAIASYKPKDKPTIIDDSSLPNNQQLEEIDVVVFGRGNRCLSPLWGRISDSEALRRNRYVV